MADNYMIKELSFALYCIKKNVQSSSELRTSFLMNIVGMMINNTAFVLLWVFFSQAVGTVGGWGPYDVIGLMGFNAICYGVGFCLFYGIFKLPEYVAGGTFDRFLLSPKSTLFVVMTSSIAVSGLGDIVFGSICLVAFGIIIHATLLQISLALLGIVCASIMFVSLAIASHSVAFFFTDGRSISRALFEVFFTPSMFHGGAYQGVLRIFFIFVVPSLVLGALPAEIMRDISLSKLLMIAVLVPLWGAFSIWIFHRGIRKYESSNLMGFSG